MPFIARSCRNTGVFVILYGLVVASLLTDIFRDKSCVCVIVAKRVPWMGA